jgi:hypothetical protein
MTTAACLFARYTPPCWHNQTGYSSRHFRFAPAPFKNKQCAYIVFWISIGLREFLEKAIVLRLAAMAWCKQYCLSDPPEDGERVVLRGLAEKQEPKNSLQPRTFFGYFLCFKTKKVT